MRAKVTKSKVKNEYAEIIAVPYCYAQNLLRFVDSVFYSAGTYGWSCDYYEINGVCISTGYSPIGVYCDSKRLSEYEEKAECAYRNKDYVYDECKEYVMSLLNDWVNYEINRNK